MINELNHEEIIRQIQIKEQYNWSGFSGRWGVGAVNAMKGTVLN